MSWFSNNYHKALLAGAAVVTLGLLYFGWSQMQSSGDEFSAKPMGAGKVNTAVAGAERIAVAGQSMALDHGWKQGEFDGRHVNLFTGIPLFIKRNTEGQAIDLLKDSPVHPPIPNSFWLDYGVDPGFADSPLRDDDNDGFSNLEEWRDETDPTDADDHPLLIKKLMFVRDESVAWVLRPGFIGQDGSIPMKYSDGRGFKNNAGAGSPVKPGEVFFANGAAQGRFKLIGHAERKEMNKAINVEETIIYARIEDMKDNKSGNIYEIPAPLSVAKQNAFIQHDRSAVLVLQALGKAGKEIVIEENTRFALPADADKKQYLLKSVSPDKIVVEYPGPDGNPIPVEILKGSLPRL